jgi:polyisoprenoid-binding protein YceI
MSAPLANSLFAALLAMLPMYSVLAQESYAIDPVHTRVIFRVMHAEFSPSIGTVSQPSGMIWFDEKDITRSHVEVNIPVINLDMGDKQWTEKVTSRFLMIEKFPIASFKSTAVRVVSENLLEVDGNLSVAGKSAPIKFITLINANKRHPLTFKKTLGMQAFGNISRKALGIDAWPSVIGDMVHFDLSIEATLSTNQQADKQP